MKKSEYVEKKGDIVDALMSERITSKTALARLRKLKAQYEESRCPLCGCKMKVGAMKK